MPFWIRRYCCYILYCIVLYCTIHGVALTERYIASWEHYVAIWERSVALWENNVTNVVSTQRHFKLLMICITVKPVEERENFVKNCVIGLNIYIYLTVEIQPDSTNIKMTIISHEYFVLVNS